jgi:hypothetical protein
MIPWFVSDVTPSDFKQTFELLLDALFFDPASEANPKSREHLVTLVNRWRDHVNRGIFSLSVSPDLHLGEDTRGMADFWTSPYPYWNMRIHSPELFKYLCASDLVIFKVN